jgi:hypothetical protein
MYFLDAEGIAAGITQALNAPTDSGTDRFPKKFLYHSAKTIVWQGKFVLYKFDANESIIKRKNELPMKSLFGRTKILEQKSSEFWMLRFSASQVLISDYQISHGDLENSRRIWSRSVFWKTAATTCAARSKTSSTPRPDSRIARRRSGFTGNY